MFLLAADNPACSTYRCVQARHRKDNPPNGSTSNLSRAHFPNCFADDEMCVAASIETHAFEHRMRSRPLRAQQEKTIFSPAHNFQTTHFVT